LTAALHKHLRQLLNVLVKIIYYYYYYLYQNCRFLSQMPIFYVVTYLLLFPTKIGIFGKDNIYILLSLPKYQEYGGEQLFFCPHYLDIGYFIGAKPRWDVLSLCRGEGGADWKLKKFYVII